MLNMMYKYAMKYDLCGKDYSEYIDILKYMIGCQIHLRKIWPSCMRDFP